jgi:hypothetical protein
MADDPGHPPGPPCRVLLVEPDPGVADLWHFVLTVAGVARAGTAGSLRCEPATRSISEVGEWTEWHTIASLLVRATSVREPIVYDMTWSPLPAVPDRPSAPNGAGERSTPGRAKAPGQTLADRARQAQNR